MKMELKGDYYTTNEAAEAIGVTPGRVRQWVCWDEIKSIRAFGRVLIPKSEVDRLKKVEHTIGRPRKSAQ